MSKNTEPAWVLTPDYGVGLDSLNWRLYRRTMDKKTGEPKGWKVDSFYPRLRDLLAALMDSLMLTDTGSRDIPEHVDAAIEACGTATRALLRYMNTINAGLDTLPPKYASFATKEKAA